MPGFLSQLYSKTVAAAAKSNRSEILILFNKVAPIGSFTILASYAFLGKRSEIVAPPPAVKETVTHYQFHRGEVSHLLFGANGS